MEKIIGIFVFPGKVGEGYGLTTIAVDQKGGVYRLGLNICGGVDLYPDLTYTAEVLPLSSGPAAVITVKKGVEVVGTQTVNYAS